MENELVVQERMTAVQIKADVQLIQQVMEAVMIGPTKNKPEGVHYGLIPGCGDKPTLLKPGAEKIASAFKLAVKPIVDNLSSVDEVKYLITVELLHMVTGAFIGSGIGECSSNELKYKWRKPVCKEEFDSTPEDRKRKKWQAGYNGGVAKEIKQVRTEIADIANTILKMAKKRALIDAVLTATAASDCFTQDLEDLPSEILGNGNVKSTGKPAVQMPEVKESPERENVGKLGKIVFGSKGEYSQWMKDTFKVSCRKDLTDEQVKEAVKILKTCAGDKK